MGDEGERRSLFGAAMSGPRLGEPTEAAHFDAVVVGAGPAGAAAAILLAGRGWRVALVEKVAFPRRKVCGECIAASNLPLLDALGVGAAVDRLAGAPLTRVALWRGDEAIVAALPAAAAPRHAFGRALGREALDTLLVARARGAGATVLQPAAVLAIDGAPGDFRCRVRVDAGASAGTGAEHGERELRSGVVIAAHGSWEPLPVERAERRRARTPSDLFAFKANFSDSGLAPGLLPVLAFAGGYGGMVVADHGQATLACCIREATLERLRRAEPGERAGDSVQRYLESQCRGVADALRGARRDGAWLASGPLRPGIRVDAHGDGVFRIGNAAGEAHPIVGEGISMALQSAWLLARSLDGEREALLGGGVAASAAAQRRLLVGHAALWRRRFARRLRIAAAFAHVAMRPGWSAALWPLVAAWPATLTAGARWSGKTEAAFDVTAWPQPLRA